MYIERELLPQSITLQPVSTGLQLQGSHSINQCQKPLSAMSPSDPKRSDTIDRVRVEPSLKAQRLKPESRSNIYQLCAHSPWLHAGLVGLPELLQGGALLQQQVCGLLDHALPPLAGNLAQAAERVGEVGACVERKAGATRLGEFALSSLSLCCQTNSTPRDGSGAVPGRGGGFLVVWVFDSQPMFLAPHLEASVSQQDTFQIHCKPALDNTASAD